MSGGYQSSAVRDSGAAIVESGHDFTSGIFVAQHARPPGLEPVDPTALDPFRRALLVIDGTVTKFLEAYALEPVEVVRLAQRHLLLPDSEPWLQLQAAAPVIQRQVMLRGTATGNFLTWADSVIAAERLPEGLREGLARDRGGGLGRILLESEMETRREGLWFGRQRAPDVPAAVARLWHGEFLVRTYRVLAGGQPLMLITERFPFRG